MKQSMLTLAMVTAILAPTVVTAPTPTTGTQGEFRFDLEEASSHRGHGVEGYVYNGSQWRITNVRLRVESVDPNGAVTNEASGWVVGDVKAGGRAYFYVPVPSHAASYRATVQSFDRVMLETPRTEAP
jgi:hypothetical protein